MPDGKDRMSDLGFAAQLAEDLSPDDLRLVLGVFRADVERLAGQLAAAVRDDDGAAFRRAAHGLAGAAGAVGAVPLELACRHGMVELAPTAATLAGIDQACTAALGELAAFLARLDAMP